MLQRLSQDWEERWGHPIVLVETFADPRYCQGAACKVSGWSHLGKSAGWKRDADDFYEKNDAPKQIRVRELVKKACLKLRARQLPAEWAQAEQAAQVRCAAKVPQIRSRMETLLKEAPEFRRAQALAYPLPGLVALMVMAAAQGALRGPQDLADYADTLSQGQKQCFSPSSHSPDSGAQAGAQPGPVGNSFSGMRGSDSPPGELSWSPAGGPAPDAGQAEGKMEPCSDLPAEQ
jgi:hypothetical protein